MLYFTRWKAAAILLTALHRLPVRGSQFLARADACSSWPKWAQRHVVLGLDLQGGSHILLEVDRQRRPQGKLEALRDDVRRVLRDARIGYTGPRSVRGNTVEVRIREAPMSQQALAKLRELSQPLGGLLGADRRSAALDVADAGGGLFRLTVDRAGDRRAHPAGGRPVDPDHRAPRQRTRHGRAARSSARASTASWCRCPACRIRQRLKEILGKTAKLTFRMVDQSMPPEQAMQRPPAAGIRNSLRHRRTRPAALSDREAGHRVGRGPDRRAAGLRPAHQRADRHRSASIPAARGNSPR